MRSPNTAPRRSALTLVAILVLVAVSLPSAQATHVPGMRWDWCFKDQCLADDGSLGIYATDDEETGAASYHVSFAGTLGSVACSATRDSWSHPFSISGSIVFPHEVAGEIVTTSVPCDDVYAHVGPITVGDLEIPFLCAHAGSVAGESALLGRIVGRGGYLTIC